ncbi:MAG: thiamine-phosphate kinase [Candidatus Omnitrophota bacterium]
MRLDRLGEFDFIRRVSRGINLSGDTIKGIGDDAAVLRYKKDAYLLFTTDMLAEGRHFHKSHRPYLVGRKSVSCNISDIAAMGGRPAFCLISLGAPGGLDIRYADELYRGIKDAAGEFSVDVVGGDTVGSDKIVISVAMLGVVERNNLVSRAGAKRGDAIFLTGSVGGSIKGRHLDFTPRLKEARFLVRNFKINSMIDVSDGLAADLNHILESSGAGAVIHEKDIPVSSAARGFDSAIRDGEDFELIFTLPESQAGRLVKKWPFRTRLSRIGDIAAGKKGLCLVRKNNKTEKIRPSGYVHF